jgi:hypothetical protein
MRAESFFIGDLHDQANAKSLPPSLSICPKIFEGQLTMEKRCGGIYRIRNKYYFRYWN